MQTQNATEEITKKIEALQRDAAGSVDAVHRITQSIEAIRPVFENVNGAVAEQSETTGEMADNAATASDFIVSVGDSAGDIDSATKEAEAHGESVASAGAPSPVRAETQGALRGAAAPGQRTRTSLSRTDAAVQPHHRDRDPAWLMSAPVYEISMGGILVCGAGAAGAGQELRRRR